MLYLSYFDETESIFFTPSPNVNSYPHALSHDRYQLGRVKATMHFLQDTRSHPNASFQKLLMLQGSVKVLSACFHITWAHRCLWFGYCHCDWGVGGMPFLPLRQHGHFCFLDSRSQMAGHYQDSNLRSADDRVCTFSCFHLPLGNRNYLLF